MSCSKWLDFSFVTKHGQLELFEPIIVRWTELPFYDLPGRSPKPHSSACGFALVNRSNDTLVSQ